MDFKCSVPESLSKPDLNDQKLECFGKPLSFYENETADTKFTQSDRRQINLSFKNESYNHYQFQLPVYINGKMLNIFFIKIIIPG